MCPTAPSPASPSASELAGLPGDAAVWGALAADPRCVVIDAFFGSTGGPAGDYYDPGDSPAVTDPRTGRTEQKTIAGVLANGMASTRAPVHPTYGSSSTPAPPSSA
ncbi:hypothetical protein ACGF5F_33190 [Streptomyces sp. NPDC047821]|uniref:hypothetical protein n=1 Tax=Streptomyces sp. NPDC047821 TaxID=3365488 RepID=UPI003721E823